MNDENVKKALLSLESTTTRGYVPTNRDGSVVGNSGVTIAKGFDLGQHSTKDLFRLGIPPETLVKLVPYMEKKKDDAVDALRQQPLSLTEDEMNLINDVVYQDQKEKAVSNYEKNTGFAWDNLPAEVQEALTVQSFQMGSGLYKNKGKETNFTKQLRKAAQDGDYTEAAQNLATWSPSWTRGGKDGLLKRVKAAADVMLGNAEVSEMGALADDYLAKMRDGSVSRKYKPTYTKPTDADFEAAMESEDVNRQRTASVGEPSFPTDDEEQALSAALEAESNESYLDRIFGNTVKTFKNMF